MQIVSRGVLLETTPWESEERRTEQGGKLGCNVLQQRLQPIPPGALELDGSCYSNGIKARRLGLYPPTQTSPWGGT